MPAAQILVLDLAGTTTILIIFKMKFCPPQVSCACITLLVGAIHTDEVVLDNIGHTTLHILFVLLL